MTLLIWTAMDRPDSNEKFGEFLRVGSSHGGRCDRANPTSSLHSGVWLCQLSHGNCRGVGHAWRISPGVGNLSALRSGILPGALAGIGKENRTPYPRFNDGQGDLGQPSRLPSLLRVVPSGRPLRFRVGGANAALAEFRIPPRSRNASRVARPCVTEVHVVNDYPLTVVFRS